MPKTPRKSPEREPVMMTYHPVDARALDPENWPRPVVRSLLNLYLEWAKDHPAPSAEVA